MSSDLIWHNEKRKVKDLIPWDKNPRELTAKQAKDLTTSLEKFGLVDLPSINLDGKNTLLGGHARCKILMLLGRGDEEIEVRVPSRELNEDEVLELNIRLNKNQGQWDWDTLSNFDENSLLDFGFEPFEIGVDAKESEKSSDKSITDLKEIIYNGKEIRQITLFYKSEKHKEIVDKLEARRVELGVESFSDVVEDLVSSIKI